MPHIIVCHIQLPYHREGKTRTSSTLWAYGASASTCPASRSILCNALCHDTSHEASTTQWMQSGSLHAIVPLLHKLELHLTTAVDGGRSEITGDWFHSSLPHSAHQASGCEPSEGGESIKRRLSSHSAWLGSHGRCFARTFGKFTSAMPLARKVKSTSNPMYFFRKQSSSGDLHQASPQLSKLRKPSTHQRQLAHYLHD